MLVCAVIRVVWCHICVNGPMVQSPDHNKSALYGSRVKKCCTSYVCSLHPSLPPLPCCPHIIHCCIQAALVRANLQHQNSPCRLASVSSPLLLLLSCCCCSLPCGVECVMAVTGSASVKVANKRRNASNKQRHLTTLASSMPSKRGRAANSDSEGRGKQGKRRRTVAAIGGATDGSAAENSSHIYDIASALLTDESNRTRERSQLHDDDGIADSAHSGSESDSSSDDEAAFESAPRRFAQQSSNNQRLPVRSAKGQWTDSTEEERRSRQQQWLTRHSQLRPHSQQLTRPAAELQEQMDDGEDGDGTTQGGADDSEQRVPGSGQYNQQPAPAPDADEPQMSAEDMRRQRQRRVTHLTNTHHTHAETKSYDERGKAQYHKSCSLVC